VDTPQRPFLPYRATDQSLRVTIMTNGTDPGDHPGQPWWESLPTSITSMEIRILIESAEGLCAREVAEKLGVTENVVNDRLRYLCRKLRAENKPNTIAIAVQLGLI
jgi:DNA-binding CsgD family transcriptional regulator